MVKGIHSDLDKIIDSDRLPQIIHTTLLMFKDNIIYNSFLSYHDIAFGSDFKSLILKDYETAQSIIIYNKE